MILNTRADLDALAAADPAAHAAFVARLRASVFRREDVAEYPEGYDRPGYEGPVVEPVWADVEDLASLQRYGFASLAELEASAGVC